MLLRQNYTCENCKAWGIDGKCVLGYKNEFNHYTDCKPLEKCPKPTKYNEFVRCSKKGATC